MPIDSYQKKYRIRLAQKGNSSKSFEVTFPYMVLEKEARKRNLTVEQFIEQYQAVAQFNGFEGVNYTFEEIPQNGK